jgi:hypothetical protein
MSWKEQVVLMVCILSGYHLHMWIWIQIQTRSSICDLCLDARIRFFCTCPAVTMMTITPKGKGTVTENEHCICVLLQRLHECTHLICKTECWQSEKNIGYRKKIKFGFLGWLCKYSNGDTDANFRYSTWPKWCNTKELSIKLYCRCFTLFKVSLFCHTWWIRNGQKIIEILFSSWWTPCVH